MSVKSRQDYQRIVELAEAAIAQLTGKTDIGSRLALQAARERRRYASARLKAFTVQERSKGR